MIDNLTIQQFNRYYYNRYIIIGRELIRMLESCNSLQYLSPDQYNSGSKNILSKSYLLDRSGKSYYMKFFTGEVTMVRNNVCLSCRSQLNVNCL